jgi:hypothetical protein
MCVLFHKFMVHFCHSKETKQPVIFQVLRTWNTIVKTRFRSEKISCRFIRRQDFTVKVFPLPILIPSALNIHTFIIASMDGKLIWRNSSKTSAHLTPKMIRGRNIVWGFEKTNAEENIRTSEEGNKRRVWETAETEPAYNFSKYY